MESVTVDTLVVTATFTLRRADHVRAFLFHLRTMVWWFSGCVGGLGGVMLMVGVFPPADTAPASLRMPLFFICGACTLPLMLAAIALIEFSGRHGTVMTWSFLTDRIEYAGSRSSGVMPWTAFSRIRETSFAFLFYPQ